MEVNPELEAIICNYCGNKMLIDREVVEQKITGGFEFGYQQEQGRLKAQQEEQQKRIREEEKEARKNEILYQRKKREEIILSYGKDIRNISIGLMIIAILISVILFGKLDGTIDKAMGVVSGTCSCSNFIGSYCSYKQNKSGTVAVYNCIWNC